MTPGEFTTRPAEARVLSVLPRSGRRSGLVTFRAHRTRPEATRLGWALGLVILILAAGIGVAVARAQEIDAAALAVPAAVATETAPTPVPTATEPARWQPSARGGRAVVEELAAQHFAPERVPWAVRTAGCETGGTYDLYARSHGFDARLGVWYDFNGAWQVDAVTWAARAWALFGGQLSDPWIGAAMAAWILERQGPGAWPICGR